MVSEERNFLNTVLFVCSVPDSYKHAAESGKMFGKFIE